MDITSTTGLTPILPLTPAIQNASDSTLDPEAQEAQLKKIGQDFESIFYSLMLKEMRNSIGVEDGNGLFAGEGSDTMGGLFDMFMSQHLASGSQLGIGTAIEAYLGNKV